MYFILYKIFSLGLFIYVCRLHLTLSSAANTHDQQAITGAGSVAAAGCNDRIPDNNGASGNSA